jgi:hypothetical protein
MIRSWILLIIFFLSMVAAGCSKKTGCPSIESKKKMKNEGLFDKKMR